MSGYVATVEQPRSLPRCPNRPTPEDFQFFYLTTICHEAKLMRHTKFQKLQLTSDSNQEYMATLFTYRCRKFQVLRYAAGEEQPRWGPWRPIPPVPEEVQHCDST